MAAPANANGHRRRQLVARVRTEEDHCGICDQPIDKTLTFTPRQHGPRCTNPDCTGCIPDPMRGEVDEIIPRAHGGSPLTRANTHHVHRQCNSLKGTRSLEWARAFIRGEAAEQPGTVTTLVDW